MQCRSCSTPNDADALFCTQCGRPLAAGDAAVRPRPWTLLAALVLSAVLLAVMAGIGYYKFVLPKGIAATVNGEEITKSELDAAVAAASGASPVGDPAAQRRFRYQVLNRLILERIMQQETRKKGAAVSPAEISQAVRTSDVSRMQNASVRIALEEQWSAAGCGCCEGKANAAGMQKNCRMAIPSAK